MWISKKKLGSSFVFILSGVAIQIVLLEIYPCEGTKGQVTWDLSAVASLQLLERNFNQYLGQFLRTQDFVAFLRESIHWSPTNSYLATGY